QVVHFYFDGQSGKLLARGRDSRSNRVRLTCECGQVVVLDEDAVEEAHAVVLAAAAADGVFGQQPPAGQRLARVEDLARQAGHGVHVAARQRRDAAEVLKAIERGAFGGEDAAHTARYAGDFVTGLQGFAILLEGLQTQVRIDGG